MLDRLIVQKFPQRQIFLTWISFIFEYLNIFEIIESVQIYLVFFINIRSYPKEIQAKRVNAWAYDGACFKNEF